MPAIFELIAAAS